MDWQSSETLHFNYGNRFSASKYSQAVPTSSDKRGLERR